MRRRGITYDTGFTPFGERRSRPAFDPKQVRRELAIIARDLHCNAVRVTGRDTQRLVLAAECALAEGLEVWFSPFPCNLGLDQLMTTFEASARAAERLRVNAGAVVLVLGCELTMFNQGFIQGDSYLQRMQHLLNPAATGGMSLDALVVRFQAFLARAVAEARKRFGGLVTYASGPWEPVDWSAFDLVSVDHYRNAGNHAAYVEQLQPYFQHGKPVVVTEFGCCTYQGAADLGALGWTIVDREASPPRLTEPVVRDERGQADHVTEMLGVLEDAGVDGAFWHTFASYSYPHGEDPALDLDCASYGVVKVLEGPPGTTYRGLPWEPKLSFAALADAYKRLAAAPGLSRPGV